MSLFVATDLPNLDYERQVQDACAAALRDGPIDFAGVLRRLDGADPLVVLTALDNMPSDVRSQGRALAESARESHSSPDATPLPVPHPLDFGWLFTQATINDLIDLIGRLTAPGAQVVYLGTPTVVARASIELADRRHVLLDHDPRQTREIRSRASGEARVVNLLRDPLPDDLRADICLADPPWYPGETTAFVNAAARLLIPGGSLLLAFGGPLTRPRIVDDLAQVVGCAAEDGLHLLGRVKSGCRYETPPFEYASMFSAGVRNVPRDWRGGQLLHFERTVSAPTERRRAPVPQWQAVEIGELPIRVRSQVTPQGDALLSTLVVGDILPSVSRRVPAREHVALWTSRNRVFGSSDPAALTEVTLALANGRRLPSHPQAQATVAALYDLVGRERRELGLAPSVREVA